MDRDQRIAIVGGGAAGVSLALYLKDLGFRHVTVFESSARVGGKCKSLTYQGRGFDLGANYITASYRQVRRMAKRFGMRMFTEAAGHAVDPRTGELRSILSATTANSSLPAVAWASLRYLIKRWWLNPKFTPAVPGFVAASREPSLCQPFSGWLESNGLKALEPIFNVPITLMGYSKLSEISAAYALSYMNVRTFINLVLFALDPPFRQWPKRFDLGYERLIERMSEEVDVLRQATIERIERGQTVTIDYRLQEADDLQQAQHPHTAEFDLLVLACPLRREVLEPMLTLSPAEGELVDQVQLDPFVVATYPTACQIPVHAVSFCFPRPAMGEPYVVTQQFADVDLLSLYTRVDPENRISRDDVLAKNREFLRRIGAAEPDVAPYTYDEFPYFPHVSQAKVAEGFYLKLDAQQGRNRTYYVGGLLGFELVETIFAYSRYLAHERIAKTS